MTAKPCETSDPEECGSPCECLDDERYTAYSSLGWGLWSWALREPWRYRLHWEGFPDAAEREARRERRREFSRYASPPVSLYARLMIRLDPYIPFRVWRRRRVCFNHWLETYGLHPKRDPVDGGWYYVSSPRYYGRFYAVGMIVGDDHDGDDVRPHEARDILPPTLRHEGAP